MLPRTNLENLHAVMAILFLCFSNNFQANFVYIFYFNSECFAEYDAFCSHIFDYACLKRKAYIAIEEVRNCGKIVACTSKTF